jgi:ubiquinone/menaquinone biosynthesis C-methylase UbiE
VKTFENRLPVRPRKKWDNIEQYIEYLRHFMAYKYVKKFVKGKSVLEIGCGTGYGANYLSHFVSDIAAIDISKKCVTYCHIKHKKEKLNFLQASGLNIPLKDCSIDVAVSFQVIEHIEPKKVGDYLSEIKRVLKDGGVFVASTPNKKLRLLPFQRPWNPEHKKEYNHSNFKKTLSSIFEEVKVYGLKGSEEIQSIERNRVKQNPFNVYVIRPLIPLSRRMLPYRILFQLKRMKKSVVRDRKKHRSISKSGKKIRIDDFKLLSDCPKDCLDFYGICKK